VLKGKKGNRKKNGVVRILVTTCIKILFSSGRQKSSGCSTMANKLKYDDVNNNLQDGPQNEVNH